MNSLKGSFKIVDRQSFKSIKSKDAPSNEERRNSVGKELSRRLSQLSA